MVRTLEIPLRGTRVQSLVRELRSRKPQGAAKKNKIKKFLNKNKKKRSICSRDCVWSAKPKNIYSLALYRKHLLTPGLNCVYASPAIFFFFSFSKLCI